MANSSVGVCTGVAEAKQVRAGPLRTATGSPIFFFTVWRLGGCGEAGAVWRPLLRCVFPGWWASIAWEDVGAGHTPCFEPR